MQGGGEGRVACPADDKASLVDPQVAINPRSTLNVSTPKPSRSLALHTPTRPRLPHNLVLSQHGVTQAPTRDQPHSLALPAAYEACC